jgi:hypothetical protein
MFDNVGQAFFAALSTVVEKRLGREHPCFQALDAVVEKPDPSHTVAVQTALDGLDPAMLAEIMAETHKALRENPAAILGFWPTGAGRTRH